jgi:ArsR family transcriptional regulator
MRDEINDENAPAIYGEALPRHRRNLCAGISPDITRSMRPLKIAAHPVRLKMLLAIGGNEVSVQDIATKIGIEPNSVSKHLALLFDQ